MTTGYERTVFAAGSEGERSDPREIVLGLHWDPPQAAPGALPDLDALCLLYDTKGNILEIIHPANPRNANGSVVHTGDSRTGTSTWDDERIFVFLDALPHDVSALAFVVVSAGRHSFDQVPGAVCHASERISESELVRVDLAALTGRRHCIAATLHRGAAAWRIETDRWRIPDPLPVEVQSLLERGKNMSASTRRLR